MDDSDRSWEALAFGTRLLGPEDHLHIVTVGGGGLATGGVAQQVGNCRPFLFSRNRPGCILMLQWFHTAASVPHWALLPSDESWGPLPCPQVTEEQVVESGFFIRCASVALARGIDESRILTKVLPVGECSLQIQWRVHRIYAGSMGRIYVGPPEGAGGGYWV